VADGTPAVYAECVVILPRIAANAESSANLMSIWDEFRLIAGNAEVVPPSWSRLKSVCALLKKQTVEAPDGDFIENSPPNEITPPLAV
jgi:hypothetical protein